MSLKKMRINYFLLQPIWDCFKRNRSRCFVNIIMLNWFYFLQTVDEPEVQVRKSTDEKQASFKKERKPENFKKDRKTESFKKERKTESFKKDGKTGSIKKDAKTESFKKDEKIESVKKDGKTASFKKSREKAELNTKEILASRENENNNIFAPVDDFSPTNGEDANWYESCVEETDCELTLGTDGKIFQSSKKEKLKSDSSVAPKTDPLLCRKCSGVPVCQDNVAYILEKAHTLSPANLPMMVIQSYKPANSWTAEDEVEVKVGQVVHALYKQQDWVYIKTNTGKIGFVPYRAIQFFENKGSRKPSKDNDLKCICNGQDMNTLNKRTKRSESSLKQVSTVRFQDVKQGKNSKSSLMDESVDQIYNEMFVDSAYSSHQEDDFSNSLWCYEDESGSKRFYYYDDFDLVKPNKSTDSVDSAYHTLDRKHKKNGKNSSKDVRMSRIVSETSICKMSPGTRDKIMVRSDLSVSQLELQDNFSKCYTGPNVTIIFDYKACNENDISVRHNDVVTLLNDDDPHWLWVMRDDGEEGFVPRNFVVNLQALNIDPRAKTTYF